MNDVHDQELVVMNLCGPDSKFEHLVVRMDAVANNKKLAVQFVKVVC